MENLLAKINVDALKRSASTRRDGIPCIIPALDQDLDTATRTKLVRYGGQNCHLDISFSDGVSWIARIRLQDPALPPPGVQKYIFLSEVATLQFLTTNTTVPSPCVYHYQEDSPENPVGTSYILMEKKPGKPLNWNRATPLQRRNVMEQLADVYIELSGHPFAMTGSLFPPDQLGEIGGFAQAPWFETPEKPFGPFETLEAAYTAMLQQQLNCIHNKEVTALASKNQLDLNWRLHLVPRLVLLSTSKAGPFYLKHNDDKGDHILVDEEYNITGIIDWEFASLEAKELAFSSPCMMWPVRKYYEGLNELSEEEVEFAHLFQQRGHDDLRDIVLNGRLWQRFMFFLSGLPREESEFRSLHQGLRNCLDKDKDISYEAWEKEQMAQSEERADSVPTAP